MIVRIVILVHFIFLAEVANDDSFIETQRSFLNLATKKVYVDKTGLLIDFLSDKTAMAVYLSAPRRFGKTINSKMISKFCNIRLKKDDGYSLITNKTEHPYYKVFKTKLAHLQAVKNEDFFEEHFGNYIVFYIGLCTCAEISLEYTISLLNDLIMGYTFRRFSKWWEHSGSRDIICKEDKACCARLTPMFDEDFNASAKIDWSAALSCLFQHLRQYYNKEVILLVDEFDHTVLQALRKLDYVAAEDILGNLSYAFGSLTKAPTPSGEVEDHNEFPVFRMLITGITHLPIGQGSSIMSNVEVYSNFEKHPLSQYYGFNQEEVDGLLERFGLQDKKDNVKDFYDGYKTIGADWQRYNPLSVSKFISSGGRVRSYWRETGTVSYWFRLCKYAQIFNKIDRLSQGKTVDLNIIAVAKVEELEIMGRVLSICDSAKPPCIEIKEAHYDYFFRYLLQEGYLSPADSSKETKHFTAPNEEIRQEYRYMYGKYVKEVIDVKVNQIADMFWKMAATGVINDQHVNDLKNQFNKFVRNRIKNEDYYHYNEQALRSLVFTACEMKTVKPVRDEFAFNEVQVVHQNFINLMSSDGVGTTHKPLKEKAYGKADIYLNLNGGKTIMMIEFKVSANPEEGKDQVLGYRPREEDEVACEKLFLVWVTASPLKSLRHEIKVSVGCYVIDDYNKNPYNPIARKCPHDLKNQVNLIVPPDSVGNMINQLNLDALCGDDEVNTVPPGYKVPMKKSKRKTKPPFTL